MFSSCSWCLCNRGILAQMLGNRDNTCAIASIATEDGLKAKPAMCFLVGKDGQPMSLCRGSSTVCKRACLGFDQKSKVGGEEEVMEEGCRREGEAQQGHKATRGG